MKALPFRRCRTSTSGSPLLSLDGPGRGKSPPCTALRSPHRSRLRHRPRTTRHSLATRQATSAGCPMPPGTRSFTIPQIYTRTLFPDGSASRQQMTRTAEDSAGNGLLAFGYGRRGQSMITATRWHIRCTGRLLVCVLSQPKKQAVGDPEMPLGAFGFSATRSDRRYRTSTLEYQLIFAVSVRTSSVSTFTRNVSIAVALTPGSLDSVNNSDAPELPATPKKYCPFTHDMATKLSAT